MMNRRAVYFSFIISSLLVALVTTCLTRVTKSEEIKRIQNQAVDTES